jgi:hypothetical protein
MLANDFAKFKPRTTIRNKCEDLYC